MVTLTLTIDGQSWLAAGFSHPMGRAALDIWLENVTGRPLGEGLMIRSATLGEGYLETEETSVNDDGLPFAVGDYVATETHRYATSTMPPWWPGLPSTLDDLNG